jgi:hypothetical protein
MGAPASRRSSQSAFSRGTKMWHRPGGGPTPGCLAKGVLGPSRHGWCCGHHMPDSSAKSFHDCNYLTLRTQGESMTLCIVAWPPFDLRFDPSSKVQDVSLSESGWGPPVSGWDRANKKNKGPRLSGHFSRKQNTKPRCKRLNIISWSRFRVSSRVLVIAPPAARGRAAQKGGVKCYGSA